MANVIKKNKYKNASLLLTSLIFSLLFLEISLRLLDPFDNMTFQIHDRYIYLPIKNSKSKYVQLPQNGGKVIPFRFNNLGFRGEDIDLNNNDKKRIVVYGDSFIQASYTPLAETFSKKLETILRDNFKTEIINAGVDGYGPDQTSLRLKDELDWLKPDLVIVSIFADNDFGDLLRNKIYRLDSEGQLIPNRYILSQEIRNRYSEKKKKDEGFMLERAAIRLTDKNWVGKRLKLFFERTLGWNVDMLADIEENDIDFAGTPQPWLDIWLKRSKEEYEDYFVKKDNTVGNIRGDHYDADISMEPSSDSARLKTRLMDGVIGRIGKTLSEKNIPLIVLIIPSPIDACENYDWQVDSSIYKNYQRHSLANRVESSAKHHSLNYLNLFQPFNQENCNNLFFHHGNNHWNEKGQEKAARLMSEFILSEKYFGS